jgi:DNA invertase Pin-like site-specific DNA recombinase
LAAALKTAKRINKGAPVIVSKLDRLSRDVAFIVGLMAQKVPFIVAALGADIDPFMLHIHAAVAQQERRIIATRTREGLAVVKSKGKLLGNRTNLSDAQRMGADAPTESRQSNSLRRSYRSSMACAAGLTAKPP